MYVILIQERNGKRLKMMKNITKRHKNNESSKRLKKNDFRSIIRDTIREYQ